jgi:hypothetical protein
MFIESLHQPIQYHALENGYTKNALSFIAIEENLSDEGFIEFVLEMCKKHKELSLSIFYFNEHQKNQATKIFNQIKNKNFINPSSVEEIIKNSEIYVHNAVEEFRFTINEEYYKKVKNIQAIKENLFMVELTRKAKKKKDMAEMTVDTVSPVVFETSVVSEIFKDDERYNEFVFMNSLGSVDEEKIKDMYCPNAIGFLATEENLADDEFMGYIKELMVRFPDVEFKGFCFDNRVHLFDSSIKPIKVNDIRQLAQHVTILLTNPNTIMERTLIQSYFKNTFAILTYNKININMKIKNIINENLIALYKNNLDTFGLTSKDIQKYPNHILLASLVLSKSLNNEFKNILLNQEHTLKEHATKIITILLQEKNFIYPLNKLRKTIRRLLLKR